MTRPPAIAHPRATSVLAVLGLLTAVGAGVALAVAGRYTADSFRSHVSPSDLARHRGAAASTAAWAIPLGVAGLATLVLAIGAALCEIRADIGARQAALVTALARVCGPAAR